MSLGVKNQKTYLNIKEGKIYLKGEPYDYIEGYLKGIETRIREFNGEELKYFYIDIQDVNNKIFSLALVYNSGIAKSLFNSLASLDSYNDLIKIEPYYLNGFTKISVSSGGLRLSWKHRELPPLKEVQVGNKIVKDDSERMAFIESLVTEINSKI